MVGLGVMVPPAGDCEGEEKQEEVEQEKIPPGVEEKKEMKMKAEVEEKKSPPGMEE